MDPRSEPSRSSNDSVTGMAYRAALVDDVDRKLDGMVLLRHGVIGPFCRSIAEPDRLKIEADIAHSEQDRRRTQRALCTSRKIIVDWCVRLPADLNKTLRKVNTHSRVN